MRNVIIFFYLFCLFYRVAMNGSIPKVRKLGNSCSRIRVVNSLGKCSSQKESVNRALTLRGSRPRSERGMRNSLLHAWRRQRLISLIGFRYWFVLIDDQRTEYRSRTDANGSFRCRSIIQAIDTCGPCRMILYRERCWGPAIPSPLQATSLKTS